MKKILVYLFLCGMIGGVMSSTGHGIDTWQWWVGCSCVWFSYLCGQSS